MTEQFNTNQPSPLPGSHTKVARGKIQTGWINCVHKAATGTRRTRTLLTPVGVVIFAGFTTLFVIAAILVDKWLGLSALLPAGSQLQLSIPIMVLGATITAWSALHFLQVKGTPVPFNPPPRLVQTGPYRYVRNPMLTGVFLFLLGLGFAINSVTMVLVFIPLYILINVWELKQIEEPELITRLGNEYIRYRSQTPMFIPGWKTLK